jgi:hypothetical protein
MHQSMEAYTSQFYILINLLRKNTGFGTSLLRTSCDWIEIVVNRSDNSRCGVVVDCSTTSVG